MKKRLILTSILLLAGAVTTSLWMKNASVTSNLLTANVEALSGGESGGVCGPGYAESVEFYSPIYDTPEKIADEKPDIRTTLYWNPYLQIGPDGTAQIEFYSNDHKNQQYDIAIEGITPDGKVCKYQIINK